MPNRLQPLFDAIAGLPDEPRAVRTIATYAMMPVVAAGIVGGAVVVPHTSGFWVLVAAAGGGALVAALLTYATVFLTFQLFGFRGVVRVGEVMLGLLVGFPVGIFLSHTFNLDWWPLLLAPAFAVLNLIFRPFTRVPPKPLDPDEGSAADRR